MNQTEQLEELYHALINRHQEWKDTVNERKPALDEELDPYEELKLEEAKACRDECITIIQMVEERLNDLNEAEE